MVRLGRWGTWDGWSGCWSLRFRNSVLVASALLWQANLQVRSLTVSETKGNLDQGVSGGGGGALGAQVEVLLPVGVGIVTLGSECVLGPIEWYPRPAEPSRVSGAESETDVLHDALAAKERWVTSVRDGQGGPSNEP